MKNERTSKRVASIAGRILACVPENTRLVAWRVQDCETNRRVSFKWQELRTLAASALTQTPGINERTSGRVASIAGKVLGVRPRHPDYGDQIFFLYDTRSDRTMEFNWRSVRTLAASCLTQAPDKPKRKKRVAKKIRVSGVWVTSKRKGRR